MSKSFEDLTNKKFNSWKVLYLSKRVKGVIYWMCECECGTKKEIASNNLRSGKSKSCGCKNISEDLVGKRFGRLIVISREYKKNTKQTIWLCRCDCGNEILVAKQKLINHKTISCGCYRKEMVSTHNMSQTRIYRIWIKMKERCYNQNHKFYKNYGGRGIRICEEWLNKKNGFINLYNWAIENGYEENLTIERIDVNGNYEPNNCAWITMKEQARNKRNTIILNFNNEEKTLIEWAEITGINKGVILKRINSLNWSIEKALTTPVIK